MSPCPRGRCWIESANYPETAFPLASLPYGSFAQGATAHLGTAIGDQILDLHALAASGLVGGGELRHACQAPQLNPLLELGRDSAHELRHLLTALLQENAAAAERDKVGRCLRPIAGAELQLPLRLGEFTDFYASIAHARRVGALLRPERPLQPNYRHLPVGYQGRSSTIRVSGSPVSRPRGQWLPADASEPVFAPSRQLDFELELGYIVGGGNADGKPIPLAEAEHHIFGVCLLNDWSARDIQRWEGQPLGPFLGKSFATSISAWILPWEALDPWRVPARARDAADPPLLPYLDEPGDRSGGGRDLVLEAWLITAAMRAAGLAPHRLCLAHAADLYWTAGQMIAHHTSNGCRLRPGDLLASGTVSGAGDSARGCWLELSAGAQGVGAAPMMLPSGEQRSFLEDGDEIILCGYGEQPGPTRLMLGECRGTVQVVEKAPGEM